MHIVVRKTSFITALSQARGIIEKKNTVPILANVLIDATDVAQNIIKLTATDLEVSLIKETPAVDIKTPGKITVNCTKLHEVVGALSPNAEITLKVDVEKGRLTITSGRSHFELAVLPVGDYPGVEVAELPTSFTISSDILRALINRTAFAMSTEETRYYLNGIYFHTAEDGYLYAVATDGHRLSRMRTKAPAGADAMPGVIVSRKTVNTLLGLLNADKSADKKEGAAALSSGASGATSDKPEEENLSANDTEVIEVRVSDTQIIFDFTQGCLISRLVDGNFPDYNRVIPQDNDKQFSVNPGELSEVIKRVSTMCTDRTPGIKVSIEKGQLVLAADASDFGSADETVSVDYDSDVVKIGFNHNYIAEIANDLFSSNKRKGTETVEAQFSFKDESAPVIVRAANDDDVLHVLMPMRI